MFPASLAYSKFKNCLEENKERTRRRISIMSEKYTIPEVRKEEEWLHLTGQTAAAVTKKEQVKCRLHWRTSC